MTTTPAALTILLVAGTRPEGVKLGPLALALRDAGLTAILLDTGQQPGRVAEAIAPFGLTLDVELGIVRETGSLNELVAAVSLAMDGYLAANRPDAVVVQGDTTTAFVAGLAAHYRGIPVVHLEAGLRTGDPANPFPEETNRRLLGGFASLHLAPTGFARQALLAEAVDPASIVVTGNTSIDALRVVLSGREPADVAVVGKRLTVTVHRREAWGQGVDTVVRCVRRLVSEYPDLSVTVVAHPNPVVGDAVRNGLAEVPGCTVVPPQSYDNMLALLAASDVVLTDSGGIQEEAPSLGLPAVVTRWRTERPEGVDAGWADLVGLDEEAILAAVRRRLAAPRPAPAVVSPYGDSHAGQRAAQAIAWLLGAADRPADWAGPDDPARSDSGGQLPG